MKRLVTVLSFFLILSLTPDVLAQAPSAMIITIEGRLVRATAGDAVEAGIPLMLHSYDGQEMAGIMEGVTDSEGTFRFENVEATEGRIFEVMATVGRTVYFSESATVSPGQTRLQLPVTIYDTTTDTSAIRVEQMHTVLEFLNPTQMQVLEIYVISNDGDRTVEGAVALDDGRTATLRFTLPAETTGLTFGGSDAGGRFIPTADGFADTLGVPPGRETVQFTVSYLLPYRDRMRVERMLSYPTDGLSLILSQPGVSLTSDALVPRGSRQLQNGQVVDVFTAEGFQAGQTLAFELSGQPQMSSVAASPASSNQPATDRTLALAGLTMLGLALIGSGIWWWRREATSPIPVLKPAADSMVDSAEPEIVLVQAIAELDEGFQAGIVPEDEYTRQRTALKVELKALLTHSTFQTRS